MLAAHSLDTATIAQGAIASRSQVVRKHFGMSDDRKVVCAISFGFADGSHPANAFRTTRADLNEVVAWLE
jgi:nitroreductase